MEDYLQERALSYELQKRGSSSTDISSTQVPPVSSSNLNHPLNVNEQVKRRLKQRHIQMYVRDSASFPHKFETWYSLVIHCRIAASLRTSSRRTSLIFGSPDRWHIGYRSIPGLRGSHQHSRASWCSDGIYSCWFRSVCVSRAI
jgi:hypothetical protein